MSEFTDLHTDSKFYCMIILKNKISDTFKTYQGFSRIFGLDFTAYKNPHLICLL